VSCGYPHATPCSEVLEQVYLYLDGEDEAASRENVRQHLDECAPCLRKYGLEQAVKALVARCCAERAPQDLRDRVLVRLQEVRIEIEQVEYTSE